LTGQQRVDAEQKLARLERLGQIIVHTQFQSGDAVGGIAARSEHQDGKKLRTLAHAFRQLQSRFAGHHHVQNQAIERHAFHQGAGVGGLGGGADAEPVAGKIAGEQRAQALIVIHHQEMRVGQRGFARGHGSGHGCYSRSLVTIGRVGLAVFASAMLTYLKPGLRPGKSL
jgi:hypothetical protein